MKLVNYINYNTIITTFLILFGFFVTLSILSHTFDGDLGWHLRFGQDAWQGNFQYQDSYTWGFLGNDWINHEWGGDLVLWQLYSNLGYFSLNIFIAIFLWIGFLWMGYIFKLPEKNSSPSYSIIIISLLALISVKFITITRLAMLGPFFLAWLLWSLEKIPYKKTYYYWPIILYLWSFFHGSWILGFIVINIYLVGKIIELILKKMATVVNLKKLSPFVVWQLICAVLITFNPYGYKIWIEIVKYFGNNFYKAHITEWLSSYTYPIFWWPLIIVSFCAVIVYLGWKNKKITIPQLLLFIAFFLSGWMYKRNNLFMVLICIPILQFAWMYFKNNLNWNNNLKNKLSFGLGVMVIILIIANLKPTIHYTDDIWQDQKIMSSFGLPQAAVNFLNNKSTCPKFNFPKENSVAIKQCDDVRIFNSYSWGGYLIWTLPQYLYFADGRSAATWKNDKNQYILEKHLDYLTTDNGLKKLENEDVKYIILQQNYAVFRQPTWMDKLLFNSQEVNTALNLKPAQIYIDLENSDNWRKIYQDKISLIWEKDN